MILSLFHGWENRGSERWCQLPKVTELAGGQTRPQRQVSVVLKPACLTMAYWLPRHLYPLVGVVFVLGPLDLGTPGPGQMPDSAWHGGACWQLQGPMHQG